MNTFAAALACVPRQELVIHSGPSWMEWIAKALFLKHQERFVRPLLRADSEREAEAALRAHRLEYIASRTASTVSALALKPWDRLTPQVAEEFYEKIRDRLSDSPLSDEVAQKIDYVAYSSCQVGLIACNVVRRGPWKSPVRPGVQLSNALRSLSNTAAFDVLTSAAFTAAFEPSAVKNHSVFSWLMDKAIQSCDANIAFFADFGYIQD